MNNSQLEQQTKIIERFHLQTQKLSDKKFNALHFGKMQMSFFVDGKVFGNVKSQLPNSDLLKLFLIDFRFFHIKDKNPYNFEKICQFFIGEDFEKEKVEQYLKAYKDLFTDESMRIVLGDKSITNKQVFETILNAENFHQERSQKGVELIKKSQFLEPMIRMRFFNLIGKLRSVICSFDKNIVEKYLNMYKY